MAELTCCDCKRFHLCPKSIVCEDFLLKIPDRIIAVDFDGTLCEEQWPEIGEPKEEIINSLLEAKSKGARIILWTCRAGERLEEAVAWCKKKGIFFDAINENLPVMIAAYGIESRKISATEYWDDRAFNFGFSGYSNKLT